MILLSHLPGEEPFSSERFDITYAECAGDLDYSRAVQAAWGAAEPLVIVEHDMECSDALLERIFEHPSPLATYAYQLHWVSSHKPSAYCQRMGDFPPETRYLGSPISEGDEWCDFTGIGFCKIAPEARCEPLRASSWQFVDIAVNAAVSGRWAVLWPEVEHFHV